MYKSFRVFEHFIHFYQINSHATASSTSKSPKAKRLTIYLLTCNTWFSPFLAVNEHEQWVYKSCFNVHLCQQSHILWWVHMFLPHTLSLFFYGGDNLLKNGLFYFRPHTTIGSVKTYKKAREGNKLYYYYCQLSSSVIFDYSLHSTVY